MKLNNFILLLLLILTCISCSKKEIKKSAIKEKSLDLQVLEAYAEGKKALEDNDVLYAAKKFNEAEILFPQSKWAPQAALMAAYSYYSQDYYGDAIAELQRFFKVYPNHKNLDYAHYLLAICYYEQIVDEKKDTSSIIKAEKQFKFVINTFPKTEFALDAEFKLDLINDILASKEMYVGRYYFDKKKWIPSINRFRAVIDNYDTTIYAEEALHRLVEIHYIIGLEEESKKYAYMLGYNYRSSEWYERSYSIFDKMYEMNKTKKSSDKDKLTTSILKKFKSLFE